MKCLIVADGHLNKLRNSSQCKPLTPFLGLSLIERNIRAAKQAGVTEIFVIAPNKDHLKAYLSRLSLSLRISITTIEEDIKSPKECVGAILRAQRYFQEPFLLMSATDIAEVNIIQKLIRKPMRQGEIVMAVDTHTENTLVDLKTANKALIKNGRAAEYGRGIKSSHGFDVGIYYCTSVIFNALKSSASKGHFHLSAAISFLVKHNRVKAVNVGKFFWSNIHDSQSLQSTEKSFIEHYCKNSRDDCLAKHLQRPLSSGIAHFFLAHNTTPRQLRLITYGLVAIAALMFMTKSFFLVMVAAILCLLYGMFDGLDDYLAALRHEQNTYRKEAYDEAFEKVADAILIGTLSWHVLVISGSVLPLLLGMLAIIGVVLQNQLLTKGIDPAQQKYRIGHGWLTSIIFTGIVLNIPLLSLFVLAITTNVIPLMNFSGNRPLHLGGQFHQKQ